MATTTTNALPSIWFRYSTPVGEQPETCQICGFAFRDGAVVTDGDDDQIIHQDCYYGKLEEENECQ